MKNLESEQEVRIRQAALAWAVLHHIERFPELWNQGTWHCGTQFCFAGHVANFTGARWVEDDEECVAWEPGDDPDEEWTGVTHCGDRAQRLLGLTNDRADFLFYARNKLPTLRKLVTKFFGPEPVVVGG